jgi:hypothetical protein
VLLPAFYSIWVSRVLRGLQPSGEKLSWRESFTSQALAHGALALWSMEILSLAFIAMGVFILVIEPGKWLRALATIAFFGLCAGVFAFMLIVRRQRAVR